MSRERNGIRNLDLVNSFKTSWLQSGFVTSDEESQQVFLLESLLETYSELHQFPKLLSKLFLAIEEVIIESSGGVFFTQAYIHTRVLEKFINCVCSLPVGQTFDVWKLFTDVYFRLLTSPGHYAHAGAFIVAQLFSAFLLHSQLFEDTVFPIVHSRIKIYLEQTQRLLEECGNIIFSHQEVEPIQLQLSFLTVVHGYREVRFAYNVAAQVISIDCFGLVDPCCGLTFLPSHSHEICDLSGAFLSFLHGRNKRCVYLMFRLLAQKLKEWTIQGSDDKTFKSAITLFLSHTTLSIESGAVWDFNVNTINDSNYGVALWVEFLQHLPYLIPSFNRKDLTSLCSCFLDILFQEEKVCGDTRVSARYAVIKFLESCFFTESIDLQTAFMTAMWKQATNLLCSRKRMAQQQEEDRVCCSENIFRELASSNRKWVKHAESTPKSKNEDGSVMWDTIEAACKILNDGLNDMSRFPCKLNMNETLKFLKVMNYLPLEYLKPGNQMRCLIGTSAIYFLLSNSCNSAGNEMQELLNELCKVMVAVLEGVRSIWLFDFVSVSPYMKSIVSVLKRLQNQAENLLWPEKLLICLCGLATRNVKILMDFENFLLEITPEISDNAASAMAFLCVFHRLVKLFQRSYLQRDLKEVCERLTSYMCSNIAKCIKHHKRYEGKIYTLLVSCYAELLNVISSPSCCFSEEEKVKWLKYLSKVTDVALEAIESGADTRGIETFIEFINNILASRKEFASYISEDICSRSWKTHLIYLKKKRHAIDEEFATLEKNSEGKMRTLSSGKNAHYLCEQYELILGDQLQTTQNSKPLHEDEHLSISFSDVECSMLSTIAETCSDQEFMLITQELSGEMLECITSADVMSVTEYQLLLQIWRAIMSASLERSKMEMLSTQVQKILMKIHFLMNQTCNLKRCLFYIVFPSMAFISFLLEKQKVNLSKQCIVQCIHSCLAVRLDEYVNELSVYVRVYNHLWQVLNECLIHHTFTFLVARPAFVPCITKLLKSLIFAGDQDLILNADISDQQLVELCAQNLDRLLTSLAKHEKEFAKIVPYIISEYVDTVQHVTVHSSVKSHIISGINRLFDICSEEHLKMLAVSVNHSCREIYSSLVRNYRQYHAAAQI